VAGRGLRRIKNKQEKFIIKWAFADILTTPPCKETATDLLLYAASDEALKK